MQTKTKERDEAAFAVEDETPAAGGHPYAGKKLIIAGARVKVPTRGLTISRSTWRPDHRLLLEGEDVSREKFVVKHERNGTTTRKEYIGGVPAEELPPAAIRQITNPAVVVTVVDMEQTVQAARLI